ncbi:MAG: tetratricopeptide repeat protein [Armatimonadota bacterium]
MGAGNDVLKQAHECRINGEYAEAIELYNRVVTEQPENSEALWGLGLSLMNIGEFDEALELIVRASEIEPSNQLYLLDAGKHYTMLGMYEEAKPFFERVVALDANSKYGVEAKKQLSYYD